MFDIKHLDRVLAEIRYLNRRSPYSANKSMFCYRLSRMSSQRRGGVLERMIRDLFVAKNKQVRYIGGTHPFDMLVGSERVEVKSSLATVSIVGGKIRYSYQFQNIKTKNFDKLVMIFVSPEGLQIRQMTRKMVNKHLRGSKKYSNGHTLYVGRTVKKFAGQRIAA